MAPKVRRPAAAAGAKAHPRRPLRGVALPKAPARRVLRRPAARGSDPPGKVLSDLSPQELCKLGFIILKDAQYYHRSVQVAGVVLGVQPDGDQIFLDFRIHGTKDDELLRAASGVKDRRIKVHLCDSQCQNVLTGDTLLHGRVFSQAKKEDEGWFSNLDGVDTLEEDANDELEKLRLEAERLKEEKKDKKDKKTKKADKAESSKAKKKKKRKEDSGSEEDKKKKKKEEGTSDDLEPGQKGLKALYLDTGLDPGVKRRRKILKKARRIGKGKKKKDKKKEGSGSGSSDGSEDSSSSSSDGEAGGLFETDKKVKRIAAKYPGSLTAASIGEAKESLLTMSGLAMNMDKNSLPPIFCHFVRQQLGHNMSPPVLQETLTLATALDALLVGRAAFACDIMSQRVKSLESLSQGAHWTVGRQMELVSSSGQTMAADQEALEAAKRAREVAKLKQLVAAPSAPKDGVDNYGKGKKGKGWKGGNKSKSDDGGKNNKGGRGKKEDRQPWQDKEKDKWRREASSQTCRVVKATWKDLCPEV